MRGRRRVSEDQSIIREVLRHQRTYKGNSRVESALQTFLYNLQHDDPALLQNWIDQANSGRDVTILATLESITSLTTETLYVAVTALPNAQPAVALAILRMLLWQARLEILPTGGEVTLLNAISSLLEETENTENRSVMIDLLGHCRNNPDNTAKYLAKVIHTNIRNEDELRISLLGIARLAPYTKDYNAIRTYLYSMRNFPPARAAIVRLSILEISSILRHKELGSVAFPINLDTNKYEPQRVELINPHFLLRGSGRGEKVCEWLTKVWPTHEYAPLWILEAILEAGTDEFNWTSQYHTELVDAARVLIECNDELILPLLGRLGTSINAPSFGQCRIIVAILSACLENVPATVQDLSEAVGINLESLLVDVAVRSRSNHARAFAIRSLSYLRTVSVDVIEALVRCYHDVPSIRDYAASVVRQFRYIRGNPNVILDSLEYSLQSQSITEKLATVKMLSALGTSVIASTQDVFNRIIEILVFALQDLRDRKESVDLEQSEFNEVNELEDALYGALLQIIGTSL